MSAKTTVVLMLAVAGCGRVAPGWSLADGGWWEEPELDSGPLGGQDAGPDAGAPATPDAGAELDAGQPDAGELPHDAGQPGADSGVVPDAGAPSDAGALVDAGQPADAGSAPDAGLAPTDAGVDAGQPADAGTGPCVRGTPGCTCEYLPTGARYCEPGTKRSTTTPVPSFAAIWNAFSTAARSSSRIETPRP